MKTRHSRRQTAKVSHSRWLAYATASAATALTASHSAEAAIHYSGILNVQFRPYRDTDRTFPLDQAGDFLLFQRHEYEPSFHRFDVDYFQVFGIASAAFRHAYSFATTYDRYFVSKLHFGQNVSSGNFDVFFNRYPGLMAFEGFAESYSSGPWRGHGLGFVGFRFNNGAGIQYGWVRIKKHGLPKNGFEVVSYAYADPGEPIRAGQTSRYEQIPDEDSTDEQAPDQGSLGGLALGSIGLLAWRKSRSRTARSEGA